MLISYFPLCFKTKCSISRYPLDQSSSLASYHSPPVALFKRSRSRKDLSGAILMNLIGQPHTLMEAPFGSPLVSSLGAAKPCPVTVTSRVQQPEGTIASPSP